MKKLIFAFTVLLFSQFSFGQTVQDNATIPVSVTLNSILRLQVKTGGNIQFVFNTMDQYTSGIGYTAGTTTTFTVASSTNFSVSMGAEDDALYGVETGDRVLTTGSIPLNVVRFNVTGGTGIMAAATDLPLTIVTAPTVIVDAGVSGAAGAANTFDVEWSAGTHAGLGVMDYPADVYVTNVFLNLQPRP